MTRTKNAGIVRRGRNAGLTSEVFSNRAALKPIARKATGSRPVKVFNLIYIKCISFK